MNQQFGGSPFQRFAGDIDSLFPDEVEPMSPVLWIFTIALIAPPPPPPPPPPPR